ncbi:MAG: hypothetical protein ACR2QJ_07535 [Geminicoccaceae bacterium]
MHIKIGDPTSGSSSNHALSMSLPITLFLLAASLLLVVFANWRERSERPLGKTPLLSYPALQMIGIVLAVLLVAHLVSLLTGQPLRGRRMP